ncbi:hypothetical protein NLI96_g5719 [Meripilus lineatus]|uniref:DUF6535 domain-containing protein n=1 Tax=Meripilus lineatus TaxID=2056292 RepID=A0AAD5YDM4_9APHY|nr:hypothetical protein NLI96_g5719 [Physisporinus lineatus]
MIISQHTQPTRSILRRSVVLKEPVDSNESTSEPSMERNHRHGSRASSVKTMNEKPKSEVERKCEVLVKQHPEIVVDNSDGWPRLNTTLQDYDDRKVKGNYENIDTLLVFAGLFSAVLAAFLVESYKLLQRDATELSVEILIRISQQLNSFNINPTFVNSTHVHVEPPKFTPARSSVWINALWFAALGLSLVAASLGMLVKQWLREYLANAYVSPRECCRVRLFRLKGLRSYKVQEIADVLPLLLQIALILFFVGLVIFVRSVHQTIGSIVIVIVGTWLVFLLVTTILPAFSASCPYKTPFLKTTVGYLLPFIKSVFFIGVFTLLLMPVLFFGSHLTPRQLFADLSDFVRPRDEWHLESDVASNDQDDDKILLDAEDTFKDSNVLEIITHCLDWDKPQVSISTLSALIKQRSGPKINHKLDCYGPAEERILLKAVTTGLRKALIVHRSTEAENSKRQTADIKGDPLTMLARLGNSLQSRSPNDSDMALSQMAHILSLEMFSLPHSSFSDHILWLLHQSDWEYKLPESINEHALLNVIDGATKLIYTLRHPNRRDEWGSLNANRLCRFVLLCAGRAIRDGPIPVSTALQFRDLTASLSRSMSLLPAVPSSPDFGGQLFQSHSVLDMAMRLHSLSPGIIDRSLFEALEIRSLLMFSLFVKNSKGNLTTYIEEGPELTSRADWEEVLDEGEYVEVDITCNSWDTWDVWRSGRLQLDCQYRMMFIMRFTLDFWQRSWNENHLSQARF